MCSSALLAVHLLLVSLACASDIAASTRCACIDPWAGKAPTSADVAACGNGGGRVVVDGHCVPLDYGAGTCKAWDKGLGMECSRRTLAPDSCTNAWCFVNASECERPHAPHPSFGALHYSYDTCSAGAMNPFYDTHFRALQRYSRSLTANPSRNALRVAFPGDSSSQYTLVTLPDNGARDGSVVRFMADIFEEHGILWRQVDVTNTSRAMFPKSSFTSCVHDVATNATDVCWGNFWKTAERQLMAPFSSTIYADEIYLITAIAASDDSLWDRLYTPFKPFEGRVWGWLLFALVYTAAGSHFCEVRHTRKLAIVAQKTHRAQTQRRLKESEYRSLAGAATAAAEDARKKKMLRELAKAQDDSGNMEERILGALHESIGHKIREHVEEAVRKAHHKERELEKKQDEANNSQSIDWGIDESLKGKQRVVWHVQRYAQTLYEAIIGFVSLSPMTFNTIPARIINVGFGLFALMVIAMFQARLTANFATEAVGGRVNSINDAIMRREKICVMQAMSKTLIAKYPLLGANLTVPTKTLDHALAAMDRGACAHAALDVNMVQAMKLKSGLNSGVEAHANKTVVGTLVMQIPNGMPVREDLQFPLSWAIVKTLEGGAYERHKRDAQCEFIANATPGCDFAMATATGTAGGARSISIDTMWGPIMVAFFATTAGVAYSLLDRAVRFDASEILSHNSVALPLKNSLSVAREAVKRRSSKVRRSMRAIKASTQPTGSASHASSVIPAPADDVAVSVTDAEKTLVPVREESQKQNGGVAVAGGARAKETTV